MRMLSVVLCLVLGGQAFASFSEIDLVVREALDQEYRDGESCPDFYEDYFDFYIFKTNSERCFQEIIAQVRLTSCFGDSDDAPVVEALVCVNKTETGGYQAEFLEDWRPE